ENRGEAGGIDTGPGGSAEALGNCSVRTIGQPESPVKPRTSARGRADLQIPLVGVRQRQDGFHQAWLYLRPSHLQADELRRKNGLGSPSYGEAQARPSRANRARVS